MTPAERVAELRRLYESDKCWSSTDLTRAENAERLLLALAEAVRDYLAECDSPVPDHTMRRRKREKLAAAWAALGDNHE